MEYTKIHLPVCIDSVNKNFFYLAYVTELEIFLDFNPQPEFANVLLRELYPHKRAGAPVFGQEN